ncbi:MAG TPA: hypothetical protein VK464_03455 [Symbiobacteriaceae bacterium]|nr:hypothetical protein [Symbiobacteriaceae bacterium]
MKVAFHFSSDPWDQPYDLGILRRFLTHLIKLHLDNVHIRIFIGDLLIHQIKGLAGHEVVRALLQPTPYWSALRMDDFLNVLRTANAFVVVTEGTTTALRDRLHNRLLREPTYLGASQVNESDVVHSQLYHAMLVPKFRVFQRDLYVLYTSLDGERPEGSEAYDELIESWTDLGFSRVMCEDYGFRYTLLDPHLSPDSARRLDDVRSFFAGYKEGIVSDVLIRLADIDPELITILRAATSDMRRAQTFEDMAHVGVSCRRFLERLADALVEKVNVLPNGRIGNYINRLCWYVESEQSSPASDKIRALGERLNQAVKKANKGVHDEESIEPQEAMELLTGLVDATYDVLAAAPRPQTPRLKPYIKEIKQLVAGARDSGNSTATAAQPLDAMALPDEELLSSGWCYEFDLGLLTAIWGADARDRMRAVVYEAVETLSRHRSKWLRQGPFLVWEVEKKGVFGASPPDATGLLYFVTPFYEARMKRASSSLEPLYPKLSGIQGFLTSENGQPLWEGAVPLWQYESGSLRSVDVRRGFLERAMELHDQLSVHRRALRELIPMAIWSPEPSQNPYRVQRWQAKF